MKIDWKDLAKSKGYRSLKACYIKDMTEKRPFRSKDELLKKFKWIISRATHYAHKESVTIRFVLDTWEFDRMEGNNKSGSKWWFSFYGEHYQPKANSNCLRLQGVRGERKNVKKYYSIRYSIKRLKSLAMKKSTTRTGKKSRWSIDRKKRGY